MSDDRVTQQFADSEELYNYCFQNGEITFSSYIDDAYKKILILSAASFFEKVITESIKGFSKKLCPYDQRITSFIENKALKRQYHQLFNWEANNTNKFWSLFGDDLKSFVREYIKDHPDLEIAEKNFIDLGEQRNLLVHKNFAEFDVNVTRNDIYKKYCSAKVFVEFVSDVLDPDYKEILEKREKTELGEDFIKKVLEKKGDMTIAQLVQESGKSESTIRRYISKLMKEGLIQGENHSGTNVYKIAKKTHI